MVMALGRPRGLLTFAFALVLIAPASIARVQGEVTASASVGSTDYLIGDWIDVEVRMEHPPGATFTSLPGDSLGSFVVLAREPIREVSKTESAAGFRIALYDTGRVTVPPIGFLYTLQGDTTRYPVSTPPLDLAIHPVPIDTTADIRDIKPPVGLAITWREIVFPALAVIAMAVLGWVIYGYLKRRRKETPVEVEPVDTRPPHVVALEQLRIIEEKKLWQQGLLKEYYSEVTEVVRGYLKGRYGVPALEMATGEILRRLDSIDVPDTVRDEVRRMLGRADLVKFAKYRALPDENTETMAGAYAVVETTMEDGTGQASEREAG